MSNSIPPIGTTAVHKAPPISKEAAASGFQNSGHSSLHLTLYNAHNGCTFKLPKPLRFHTIASFKDYILESLLNFQLESADNQFLLTLFGMKFNFNVVNELNEVYVYDKRLFSKGGNKLQILQGYIPELDDTKSILGHQFKSPDHPPALQEAKTISAMSSNFQANETWAKNTIRECQKMEEQIKKLEAQINTIFKCISNVFLFGLNFVNGIEKLFETYHNHIKLTSMKTLHQSWEKYFANLERNMETFQISDKNGKPTTIALSSFLSREKLQTASCRIKDGLPKILKIFEDMDDVRKNVNRERSEIDKSIEQLRNRLKEAFSASDFQSKNSQLLLKVREYSQELQHDLDFLSENSGGTIEPIYNNHKNTLLPNIYRTATNIYQLLQQYVDFTKILSHESIKIYSGIANLQLQMVNLRASLKNVTDSESEDYALLRQIRRDEDYLSLTIDLPLLFGFMLIENRRQYEWNDFYLKGVVKNVLEQLTIIIEHEKNFQKLWIKKFGNFLSLLNVTPKSISPTLDITLLNNQFSDPEKSEAILGNLFVTRDQIIDYIKLINKFGQQLTLNVPSVKNFENLLERNFQELIKCTENLKRATKIVASLSIIASDEENLERMDKEVLAVSQNLKLKAGSKLRMNSSHVRRQKKNGNEVSDDADLDVIRGLKSRIKKLENLLHQQQYKNLSHWPVTRGPAETKNGTFGDTNSFMVEKRVTTDPTMYLSKNHSTNNKISREPGTPPKILDASTTIDKHLDNIRLKKENSQLRKRCDELVTENLKYEQTISDLRNEILLLRQENEQTESVKEKELNSVIRNLEIESLKKITQVNDDFDSAKTDYETQINILKAELEQTLAQRKSSLELERDQQISQLQSEVSKYVSLSNERYDGFMKTSKALEQTRSELDDALGMKNDLLQNLLSKEAEFTKERHNFDQEMNALKIKIDEMTDDYEDLMEVTQTRQNVNEQHIEDLINVSSHLFTVIKVLSETLFNFYYDFCLVLELMGLLLVREEGVLKIVRVKGLRNKKGPVGELDDQDVPLVIKPNSHIVSELEVFMDWLPDLISKIRSTEKQSDESNLLKTSNESNSPDVASRLNSVDSKVEFSDDLIKIYKKYFEGNNSKMELLIRKLTFQPENGSNGHTAFVLAISRRFKDVEGFAKKLSKEGKTKSKDITKLTEKISSKISINNFLVDDLVLFLPTKIEIENVSENFVHPWAAFNFGLPHFFLQTDKHTLKDKDWMVGRIVSIESIKITEANRDDYLINPFQLLAGVEWFYVEATEVHKI